ncbi:MAG: B12-binding domain-containing radical SAM protein, partial [Candidatus Omnitrophica bacterium]|nr:B12-binding domain-containing radical SAM protein [Candidatus Omnitrophota bacterium]
MKIKLIAPARKPEWGESFWDLKTLCKLTGRKAGGAPLALPTLAALTPSDVEVVLTDENVEPINFDEKVDLVGITGITCVIPRSYEIADEFKKRGVPVVMGGIHVSMLPEEAIRHCDSVVIGEAEEIWEQVVRDAQKGNLQKFYRAPRFPDLTNSPIPRWDLLKNDKYCYFTIQTGRGCPYDCDFCSVKVFNGRGYRHKTIDSVIEEIKTLQKIDYKKLIFFTDDNLLASPKYSEELMQRLIPLKIKTWWCQSSVNRLKDDRLLDLMYRAGCRVIFVGLESVSQKNLDVMNKGQ